MNLFKTSWVIKPKKYTIYEKDTSYINRCFCICSCNDNRQLKYAVKKYIVTKEEVIIWLTANRVLGLLPKITKDSSLYHLAKVKLGKMLSNEKALSKNGNKSCYSCHNLKTVGIDNELTNVSCQF